MVKPRVPETEDGIQANSMLELTIHSCVVCVIEAGWRQMRLSRPE